MWEKFLFSTVGRGKIGNIGNIVTLIGVLLATFLLRNAACACGIFQCEEVIVVPVLLIFFVVLMIDQTFRSTAKQPSTFFCLVVKRVIRAFLISLLWIVAVLLFTEWYGCCNFDENTRKLFCSEPDKLTTEEKARKVEVQIKSRLSAYTLLLSMTVAAFFMTWSGWRNWFIKKYSWCNKKTFYYKLILEEEKKVLEELLRKEANETLTKEITSNITRKDWDGCFNVAQQMIDEAKHQKPEATNQQINWISEGSSSRGGQHHQAAAHQQAQNYELDEVAQENTDTMPLFNESA